MKISNKIYLLTIYLLIALITNSYLGLTQITKIGGKLRDVVENDLVLLNIVSDIQKNHLEKMLIFERMIRIAEEVEYEDVPPSRQKHLIDHAQLLMGGFESLHQEGAQAIMGAKKVVSRRLSYEDGSMPKEDLLEIKNMLSKLEKTHISYHMLISNIFNMIHEGNFQFSISELNKVQSKERRLSKQLSGFFVQVKKFIGSSLQKTTEEEKKITAFLCRILLLVLFSSSIVVFIIRRITRPLKRLVLAAQEIGEGNYSVKLEKTKDEFGEVSSAFDIMSKKLTEAKRLLEEKNEELQENLNITRKQKEELEKVNKELDNFAHTVSHDIRSPLMGIMGYGAIIQNQYAKDMDERGNKAVNGVLRGVNRLNAMIDDLLELTRLSRIRNPYEDVDMDHLIHSILDRIEFKIKEQNAVVKVPENLPLIYCDRIKIGEVFLNLVNNAVKFSAKNPDADPQVTIGYKHIDSNHQFSVKDNGIGIAQENHDIVFDIFKRVDTQGEFEGTGAGLCIVKTVILDHGGKVWVESELGSGATFYFAIPDDLKVKEA